MDSCDAVLPLDGSYDSKQSSMSPTPPPKPKTRAPRHTTIAMQAWLEANDNNMYPSREQKLTLASTVNLPYNQINRWFANRRRRHAPKTEQQAQLIRHNQQRNKRLCSPTDSTATDHHTTDERCSSTDMSIEDGMTKPAQYNFANCTPQSHLATTPPAIQTINPLFIQLQALQQAQQQQQQLPSDPAAYINFLQQQAPWLLHLQQQQQQQQQQTMQHRLLFEDVCQQQQRVPLIGQDVMSTSVASTSPHTPNSSVNSNNSAFNMSAENNQCCLEQEDTYQLFRRTAHARNLTEAESLAVCALADMARATV
jgi:hypothetical protein